jgi:hypothetical protein
LREQLVDSPQVLQLAADNARLTEAARVAGAYNAAERNALFTDLDILRTRILSDHDSRTVGGGEGEGRPHSQLQWLQEQLTSTQELAEQATAEGFRLARELEATHAEKERLEERSVALEAQAGVAEAVAQVGVSLASYQSLGFEGRLRSDSTRRRRRRSARRRGW